MAGLVYWGQVNAAGDITMSSIVDTPGSQSRTSIVNLINAVVPGIIAGNPAVIAAAEAAVSAAIAGYFLPGSTPGLVTFPNASEPGIVVGRRFEIDPAAFPAGTANFHDMATSFGPGIIKVRSTGGVGQWGNSLTPGGQRATAGTAIVLCTVAVGTGDGVSRIRVAGVTGGTGAKTMGGIVAAQFNTNDFKYFRWTIGTAGNYALQRYTGSDLAGGSTTTLLSSGVIAQSNDLVDLSFDRTDGILTLTVNGAIAAQWQATDAIRASHQTAQHAGMWMIPTIGNSNYFGRWQWIAAYQSGTVQRQIVTVDSAATMPGAVKLSPEQKRQAVGNVFDIRDFGAKCDGVYLTDARTVAGQPYVWSDVRPFTSADIGKRLGVVGAGADVANANDRKLLGTIVAISGSAAQLDTAATFAVTGADCVFGTTDDLAVAKAQWAAKRAGGGDIYIPWGHTIVTQPLNVEDYVSWTGGGRDLSWVHVIQDSAGNASTAGTSDWLTCAGRDASTPLTGANFHHFGVNAQFHIHTAGYGSAVKPLNIYYVRRVRIEWMNVWNTPATAVPFDHSFDGCAIIHNIIINPGRLAPSGVGPGGSGIGAGTKGSGTTEPTLIAFNLIRGTHSALTSGPGHNGIFTEAQTGADPDLGVVGYRIIANVVEGMPIGISDTGSTGTIISQNDVIGCGIGIRLSKTTLPASYPGLHTNVFGNTIRGCTGPGDFDGNGISIYMPDAAAANLREYLHTLITGNQIFECKSWGISISAPAGGGTDIVGVTAHDNVVRACGRSGIRLSSGAGRKLRFLSIKDNELVSNGKRGIVGDRAGVLVETGTTLEGGRIQDNDIYDLAGSPTQTAEIVTTGATLTAVRRSGNTGDA